MQEQEIPGISIARGVQNINHALFADDTLLLGAASIHSARKFKEALNEYCIESGSSLNKGKCHTYYWNTPSSLIISISRCLGFVATTDWASFKYLGLPIFLKRPYSRDWLPQVEKFKNRLQAWGINWLNMAGKTILIKAVLNSLPLYQFSVLLAPNGILQKMDKHIRYFFWKGGKHNERRFPLVKWETILKPLLEGGLNIKKLHLQNIAMSGKLLWRLIAPNPGWAQLAIWRRYFKGMRSRCLDGPPPQGTSPFISLCSKAASLIRSRAHWILGNGKKISLWKDRIMDREPIGDCPNVSALKNWMTATGKNKPRDITTWSGMQWVGWKLLDLPSGLQQEANHLRGLLNGIVPLHSRKKDRRGWGDRSARYSVAQAYAQLNSTPNVPPDPALWKAIWEITSLPKIDFFCWILCHRKILTEDKLQRRGYYGPSRCSLCQESKENATHLVLNCNFSIQVWRELMDDWNPRFEIPTTITCLFATWKNSYPGPSPKNKLIKAAWSSLLKICCWQIWLERNGRVFRSIQHNAKKVAAKVKSQLKECLGEQKDDLNLSQIDIDWGSSLDLQFRQKSEAWTFLRNGKSGETTLRIFKIGSLNKRHTPYSLTG